MHSQKEVAELFRIIIENKEMNILQKKLLLGEVRKLRPPEEDRWVYRTVVWVLGIVAILTVAYPFIAGGEMPQGLLAIGSAAMGALAGYLTPTLKPKDENKMDEPPPAVSSPVAEVVNVPPPQP